MEKTTENNQIACGKWDAGWMAATENKLEIVAVHPQILYNPGTAHHQ